MDAVAKIGEDLEKRADVKPESELSTLEEDIPPVTEAGVSLTMPQRAAIELLISGFRQVDSLRTQLEEVERDSIDFADVRQRVEWVIKAIRHRRANETDLVFEAIDLDFGRPEN